MRRIAVKKHIAGPLSRFSWPGKVCRLARSECPAFFSADVTVQGETVHICFRTEGYWPLKESGTLTGIECLEILKELIHHLTEARDWMWYPEQTVISPDTVWIGTDGQIRLLCVPDSCELALFRRLNIFTESMKRLTDASGKHILSCLQREWIDKSHPDYKIMGAIDRMILDLREYSSYHFIR